jgi:putative hydrolase of the HAD superfamily
MRFRGNVCAVILSSEKAMIAPASGQRRGTESVSGLFDAVRNSLQPKPHTVALIERLARQGVPLYCLSNMPASTFAYLREQHAFWPAFSGIVISGEIKMMKPEREIFEYLLDRFDLAPAESVFVDDHLPNIEAARAIGLHTVLFRDAQQCELELEPLLGMDCRQQ